MSESTDHILALIDAGLQSSDEGGMSTGDPDSCARCLLASRASESEFCESCRAYLLGDGPDRCLICGFPDEPGHEERSTQHQPVVTVSSSYEIPPHPTVSIIDEITSSMATARRWPTTQPPPNGVTAAEAVFVDGLTVMHTRWFTVGEVCVHGPPDPYLIPRPAPLGFFTEEASPTEADIQVDRYDHLGWLTRPDGMVRHVYRRHSLDEVTG